MCVATENVSEEEFEALRQDVKGLKHTVRELKEILDQWVGGVRFARWVLGIMAGVIVLLISTAIGLGFSLNSTLHQFSTTQALHQRELNSITEPGPRFTKDDYLLLSQLQDERIKNWVKTWVTEELDK